MGSQRPLRGRADGAVPPLADPPGPEGRTYTGTVRVRLSDVGPTGRARLDAVARYLQDVAGDDAREAGLSAHRWVVRRSYLELRRLPRYEETLELATWCSGSGAAWAERRTSIRGEAGASVEAAALWVNLDPATMRPAPLGELFGSVYGEAAAKREVRARLLHERAPQLAGHGEGSAGGAQQWRWALRFADLDVLGHVNNAVAWSLLDELAERVAPRLAVSSAEVEYREPIAGGGAVDVRFALGDGTLRMWVAPEAGAVAVTALARLAPSDRASPEGR
ncbi:MAG: thioesterase [Actinomycetota bacterium]|nr:thioesterase [Actinomycetota bacterium]